MTQSFNLLKILTEHPMLIKNAQILLQTCFIMPAISSFNIACNRVSGNLEHSCISIQSLKTGSFLQGKYLKISHNKVNKNNLKLLKISAGSTWFILSKAFCRFTENLDLCYVSSKAVL